MGEAASPGMPEIDKDLLVDYGGWEVWREVKMMAERPLGWGIEVVEGEATGVVGLRGKVELGGRVAHPVISWKGGKLHEFGCSCMEGRRGLFCAHVGTMMWVYQTGLSAVGASEEKDPTGSPAESLPPLSGVTHSEERGSELRLVVRVAPNWRETLPRDKLFVFWGAEVGEATEVVPLEQLDRGRAYHWGACAEWGLRCNQAWGRGKFWTMGTLTRGRLRQLLEGGGREVGLRWEWADGQVIGEDDPFWTETDGAKEVASVESERVPRPKKEQKKREVTEGKRVRAVLDGSRRVLSLRLEPEEDKWRSWFREQGFRKEPSNGRYWLRDSREVLPFLARHWDWLRENLKLVEGDHFTKTFAGVVRAQVEVEVVSAGEGYDLKVCLRDRASGALLDAVVDPGSGAVSWRDGSAGEVLIHPDEWARLNRLQEALRGGVRRGEASVRPGEEVYWEQEFREAGIPLATPEDWQRRTRALRDFSALAPPDLPDSLEGVLRLYQKIGVAWMQHVLRETGGCLLADEMGLGKTVQAIAFLVAGSDHEEGGSLPALVLCPASVVENWVREIRRFAPGLSVHSLAHGEEPATTEEARLGGVWVASYQRALRWLDQPGEPHAIEWGTLILDEAQQLRNPKTQVTRAVRRIRARQRLALTGTPLENRWEDLLSLGQTLFPGLLHPPSRRQDPAGYKAWLPTLPSRIGPYLLRRTRGQVLSELPPRIDQLLVVEMTEAQRRAYDRAETEAREQLVEWRGSGEPTTGRFGVLAGITRLRQASVEPRLLDPSLGAGDSAKWMLFREILEESQAEGSRLLVFSQFVSVLELWRKELAVDGVSSCFLHGGTRDRQREIDTFQEDTTIPVFFLSLQAGGVGLNLTGADRVVLIDPWWNPQLEEQAISRAHRMGQERSVHALRLISQGSIEERVHQLQAEKRSLLEAVFEEGQGADGKGELGGEALQELFESD